jgi:hypothetical protein
MNLIDSGKIILKKIIKIFLGNIIYHTRSYYHNFENYTFAGFFLGFSVAVISTYFNYMTQYKKYKKAFYQKLDREISNLEGNSKDIFLEFSPYHFSFKNYKSEYKFIWSEITYCILDDRYLYITANSSMNFILDKANVDKENLDKTLLYLEMKAKFKKI